MTKVYSVASAIWSSDYFRFLRALIADPRQVGAVAPSGKSLSRLMTMEIRPNDKGVLELGPGTGAFTRALLERGIDESNLTLVESCSDFARLLQRRFPRARVLSMDASHLASNQTIELGNFGAVISGLPLLSIPSRKVMAILFGAFRCLRRNGAFYQFTYGPRCPIPGIMLDILGLKAVRIGGTLGNLPPAAVYRITEHEASFKSCTSMTCPSETSPLKSRSRA